MELTASEKNELLERIFHILAKRGLKAATMDSVATSLCMSKRTLYEIFSDKRDMIMQTLHYKGKLEGELYTRILDESQDTMSALAAITERQALTMEKLSVDFYRDLDQVFMDMREKYECHNRERDRVLSGIVERGISEGVFRKEVNYDLQIKLLTIQMESLKRMEELFPPELTLADAYRAITASFLRSIASLKGIETLDRKAQDKITE